MLEIMGVGSGQEPPGLVLQKNSLGTSLVVQG